MLAQPHPLPLALPYPPAKRGRAAKQAFAMPSKVVTRAHTLAGPVSYSAGIPAEAAQPLIVPEVQRPSEDAPFTRALMSDSLDDFDEDSDDDVHGDFLSLPEQNHAHGVQCLASSHERMSFLPQESYRMSKM